ncbi:MAG TPA: transcriptional activator RfaH [Candidatus Competibacteraceae bacterium]|nr:transcriptional activator RfaH [Candidatus Competibacteraceae bacterium]
MAEILQDSAALGHWFAVYSKPRREAEALEQLQRQGYVVFLPQVRRRVRQRGQWRDVVEALFPRYLFLRAVLGADHLAPVRSTRGVVGLVRFGGRLQPVPASVIAELERLCGDGAGLLELPPPLPPGCRVRILQGPFMGCEAELLSQDGAQRALVLLRLLGQVHALPMAVDHLERA